MAFSAFLLGFCLLALPLEGRQRRRSGGSSAVGDLEHGEIVRKRAHVLDSRRARHDSPAHAAAFIVAFCQRVILQILDEEEKHEFVQVLVRGSKVALQERVLLRSRVRVRGGKVLEE